MKELEKELTDINDIFTDLKSLTVQQGESLNVAHTNASNADVAVESGHKELIKVNLLLSFSCLIFPFCFPPFIYKNSLVSFFNLRVGKQIQQCIQEENGFNCSDNTSFYCNCCWCYGSKSQKIKRICKIYLLMKEI